MEAEESEESGVDSALAPVALFLFITSLWLPWWLVRWTDASGFRYDQTAVRLFGSGQAVAHGEGPWVTGSLLVLATIVLFIRVAAKSWYHEPGAWRRDLWAAFGFGAAALASTLAWPSGVPHFWGGQRYALANDTAQSFTETALPGLGWWVAVLATLVAGAAAWTAGRRFRD